MPNTHIGIQLEYTFYAIVLLVCGFLLGGAHTIVSTWQCHDRWKKYDKIEVRYHLVRGCQIKILDEWISEKKYIKSTGE